MPGWRSEAGVLRTTAKQRQSELVTAAVLYLMCITGGYWSSQLLIEKRRMFAHCFYNSGCCCPHRRPLFRSTKQQWSLHALLCREWPNGGSCNENTCALHTYLFYTPFAQWRWRPTPPALQRRLPGKQTPWLRLIKQLLNAKKQMLLLKECPCDGGALRAL